MSCFVIDAGGTPIRLCSGQALSLQLDYFAARKTRIFLEARTAAQQLAERV